MMKKIISKIFHSQFKKFKTFKKIDLKDSDSFKGCKGQIFIQIGLVQGMKVTCFVLHFVWISASARKIAFHCTKL